MPLRPGITTIWTDEKIKALKQGWAAGLSCSQIAGEIGGGITRCAVIGKAHRLKLPMREKGRPIGVRERKPRATRKHTRITPALGRTTEVDYYDDTPAIEDTQIPAEQRKGLLELADVTCHYPVGDVGEPGFFFCGGVAVKGMPYCSGHCRVAFQPPKPRRPYIPGVIAT